MFSIQGLENPVDAPVRDKTLIVGTVSNARLQVFGDCVVLRGRLDHDAKGRGFHGESIRTSWIELITYDQDTNETTVETRNSLYIVDGDLLTDNAIDASRIDGKALFDVLQNKCLSKSCKL